MSDYMRRIIKQNALLFFVVTLMCLIVAFEHAEPVYAKYDDDDGWAEEYATYPWLEFGKDTIVELTDENYEYSKTYKFKTKFETGYKITIKYISGDGTCEPHVSSPGADSFSYDPQFKPISSSNRSQTIKYEYMNVMDTGFDTIYLSSYDDKRECGTDVTISIRVDELKGYKIKYNLNGGKSLYAFDYQVKITGIDSQLRSDKPTRSGYTFQGWSTKKNGSVVYKAGAKYKKNANVTLYAVWNKNGTEKNTAKKTYTIKYDVNGGKGTFKNQTKTKDKTLTIYKTEPRKDGYIFKGWSTKKNDSKVVYKAGAKYKANKSATLYAVYALWKPKTYTVKYNLNGGKDKVKRSIKTHGKALTLSYDKPRKNGYLFQGWATSKKNSEKGKVAYKPGAKYKKDKKITLYAVWKKVPSGQITATFKDGATKEKITLAVPYSDKYFSGNPDLVDGKLATLSAVAASSAYDKTYAKEILTSCKFKNIDRKDKNVTRDSNDRASFSIGYKKIGSRYIVAVLIKGTSANYEWVSNFNLGSGGDHAGFTIAEKEILDDVVNYVKTKKIPSDKTDFWVTGHSRGAAIANLISRDLMDAFKQGKVFCYTFATPRVSTNALFTGYENIKNYINPGDWVTDVAPEKWGYKRYGVDIMLYSHKSGMKKKFKQYTGKEYGGFGEEGKKSLTAAFLDYTPTLEIYNNGGVYEVKDSNDEVVKKSYYPKDYCQYGLGYLLANEARASYWIAKSVDDSPQCAVVTGKLFIDGKINKKFAHAHTQAAYVAWLYAMYN